jgi:hypothetical protein
MILFITMVPEMVQRINTDKPVGIRNNYKLWILIFTANSTNESKSIDRKHSPGDFTQLIIFFIIINNECARLKIHL